jgi:hypothetical protein
MCEITTGGLLEDLVDLRARHAESSTRCNAPLDERAARDFTLLVAL